MAGIEDGVAAAVVFPDGRLAVVLDGRVAVVLLTVDVGGSGITTIEEITIGMICDVASVERREKMPSEALKECVLMMKRTSNYTIVQGKEQVDRETTDAGQRL